MSLQLRLFGGTCRINLSNFRRNMSNQPYQQHPSTSNKSCNKLIPTYCTKFNPVSIKFDCIWNQGDHFQVARYCTTERPIGLERRFRREVEKSKQMTRDGVIARWSWSIWQRRREEGTVELVLKDDSECNDGGLSVTPVIGMGGSGNTTLALPVYNDKTV